MKCYNRALELNPNFAFAWNNKAILLDQLGKNDEAVQCYHKALELAPNIALARAENLYNQNKYNEAVEWYDKFLQIEPNDVMALMNRGLALVSMQKFKEAIELYNKALEIAPNYAEAWYYKGLALDKLDGASKFGKLFKVREKNEAKECFNKARQLGLNM